MKKIYYFIFGYFILWILLFEFILPANHILPRPSVAVMSFPDLVRDYHLGINILSSVSALYLPLAAAWFAAWLFRFQIMNPRHSFTLFFDSLEWFSRFVPGIILSLLVIFWFRDVEYIKYIFIFLSAFISLVIKIENEAADVPEEYFEAASTLGIKDKSSIKWKCIEPKLALHTASLHLYLWSMLLVFEYIKGGFGLGNIYHNAFVFNDLSALFSSLFVTGIIIWAGTALLEIYIKKFFFWRA